MSSTQPLPARPRRRLLPLHAILSTVALACLLVPAGLRAADDKIFLKSGDVLEGKIREETDAGVKIEIKSGSIKEVKTIAVSEIDRIERPGPDVIAFEPLQNLVPTPSLLPAREYASRIGKVESFKTAHPDSSLIPEADKILATLQEEQTKTGAGSIKLEGEWISAADQKAHPEEIAARKLYLGILQRANAGAFIPALRDFDRLREEYAATTVYPDGVETTRKILQAYGRSLTRKLEDAKAMETLRAKQAERLSDTQKRQIEAAMAEEAARAAALVQREKAAGVRWLTVDRNNQKALADTIAQIRSELTALEKVDTEALRARAEGLYEIDSLIAVNDLEGAETKLRALLGSRGKKLPTSKDPYVSQVIQRLTEAQEEATKMAALADRENSETSRITGAMREGDGGNATETTPDTSSGEDALDALLTQRTVSAPKEEPKAAAPSSTKKKPAPRKTTTPSTTRKRSGGGINFTTIMPIFAVLLIGGTAAVYFLDKKKKEAGGGDE